MQCTIWGEGHQRNQSGELNNPICLCQQDSFPSNALDDPVTKMNVDLFLH